MGRKDVDRDRVRIRQRPASKGSGVRLLDHAFIVVTQAFCPGGHNLVGAGQTSFDGYPGIALWVADGKDGALVELSPVHGDRSKAGAEFPPGTHLRLECPVCHVELPRLARCSCRPEATLRKLFLSPKLDDAYLVGLCDVWGCTRSRVIDGDEILSEWLAGNIQPAD